VLFGPVYGGIVGGLTDFLQAITFSHGPYMPWFTITGILFGFIPGLFFIKKQKPTFVRILLAVFAGQTVGSVLLNTWLIATINALPFWATLTARAVNQAVMIPVYTILVYYIIRALSRMKVIE
jgi:ECF transporter S component (folate family)